MAQTAQASENVQTTTHWMPASAEERELVRKELEAILSSYHFRSSERYRAFLRYVATAALDDRSGDLKERALGAEIFGRKSGYDTNIDPIVRVCAGEVRKRIAQYYHENGTNSRIEIELPLGSYAPKFLLRAPGAADLNANPEQSANAERGAHPRRSLVRAILFGLAAALLVAGGIALYLHYETSESGEAATLNLWNPLFNAPRPVLIVLGTTHPSNMRPLSQETTFSDHVTNPYHHVSVSTAMALAHLSGILEKHKKGYEVKESPETNLTDIRSRPIVLVGAINNDWTMHLTAPLRFHFTFAANGVDSVDDAVNSRPTGWILDSSKPYLSVNTDYAIVARVRDPTTEGPVMVIAGLGPYGPKPRVSSCSRLSILWSLRRDCRTAGKTRILKWW
jgi:hypothetical protein